MPANQIEDPRLVKLREQLEGLEKPTDQGRKAKDLGDARD